MTSTPKVTVIVPTYNRAAYLPATLDTLVRQYGSPSPKSERGLGGEVYELIVVDDGSSDATHEAVAPYVCGLKPAATDQCNVRYERIEHGGLPAPINRGLELARGEYVMLANDHDLYAPETLAALSEALDGHPSAVLAVSNVVLVTPDASREIATYSFPYGGLIEGRRFLVEQLLPGIGSIAPHNMFRREALGCEVLDESFGWAADPELWLRLSSRGNVVHVPSTLVQVRDRDPGSELYQENHQVVSQVLRAKRTHMPEDLDNAQRRTIEAGWRCRVDKSAAVSLWRALEARHPETKLAIRNLARSEGTRTGALVIDALTRLPDALSLAFLRGARLIWGEHQ